MRTGALKLLFAILKALHFVSPLKSAQAPPSVPWISMPQYALRG